LAKPNNPKEPAIDFQDMKRGLTANRWGSSSDDPSYRLRREAPAEEDLKGAETHHYSYYPYQYYSLHTVMHIHHMDTHRTAMFTDGIEAREKKVLSYKSFLRNLFLN